MFIRTFGYAPIGGSVDEVIVESGCNNVREEGREASRTSDEMWIGGQRKHMNMHEGRCEMPEQDGVAAPPPRIEVAAQACPAVAHERRYTSVSALLWPQHLVLSLVMTMARSGSGNCCPPE